MTLNIRRLCVLLALVAVACGSTVSPSPSAPASQPASAAPGASASADTSASPSGSTEPSASGEPGPGPGGGPPSTQGLIAADLASGAIDEATSLNYRAWALFDDPRLPERFDGSASTGEDNRLFDDIAALAPTLPADQRADLERWLLRPSDPRSPLSGGPVTTGALPLQFNEPLAAASAAPTTPPTQCGDFGPFDWYSIPWAAPGSTGNDVGVRVWKCDASAHDAEADINAVLDIFKKLWGPMTAPMPAGMGNPYPDSELAQSEGDGKLDVYLVEPIAECRQRGTNCVRSGGSAVATTVNDVPADCASNGFPTWACSSYIIVSRRRLGTPQFADTIAHEFFHVLQNSHNDAIDSAWYTEASATWAGFHFVGESGSFSGAERDASRQKEFRRAQWFQTIGKSLLYWTKNPNSDGPDPQYQAWVWPLFQQVKNGPENVFLSWKQMESARSNADYDAAIDLQLPFIDNFRDFAVWNAQPAAYDLFPSSGLDDVLWQKKPNLSDYPKDPHHLDGVINTILPADQFEMIDLEALDAWYQNLEVESSVREIEIDITGIQNTANADLDVLLQLNPRDELSSDIKWRRVSSTDGKVTLCRDQADSDASRLEVVISNVVAQRKPGTDAPDSAESLAGAFRITGRLKCRVPDHYSGTISGSNSRGDSWTGSATFDLITVQDPRGGCPLGQYCYAFVSGSATWTCKSGNTVSVALSPPDNAGSITLYITQDGRPDRDRTYGGAIIASETEKCPVPPPEKFAIAAWTVVGWLSIEGTPPKIGADWRLSNSYSHTGCGIEGDCGTQSWRWDLQPIFNP
jgi:hypothetical protein